MRIVTSLVMLLLATSEVAPADIGTDKSWHTVDTCRAAVTRGANRSHASLPAVFGLLSWNIRKGFHNGWQADLQRFGNSAHLVFLQEARPGVRLQRMLKTHPHQHFVSGFGFAGQPTGVMTASAVGSAMYCSLHSREPWLGTPKGTSVTLYAVGTQRAPLLAINLHGINLSIGTRVFRKQIQALDPLLAAHTGPVVVGGDINAWSEHRLATVNALATRHGLQRVSFRPDLRTRIVGLAMDYIYLRGLDIVIAEALPVTSSDHNPLLLKLALSAAD
ncbi:MAG: endonuclease/exonuclease/phosphatase family protein [Chromatocurvus sp.]